jgi:hypothetical protein
VSSL